MNILAIDTSSDKLIVVFVKGNKVFSRQIAAEGGHSSNLMPAVDDVLKSAGAAPDSIDAVAAAVGPGSFTGIRIGVAAATALSYASGCKRIAVNSFEPIAYNRAKVTAAIDAGHKNLYTAECENGKILSVKFLTADEAAAADRDALEYCTLGDRADTLAQIVRDKAEMREFTDVFEPFYMRASQAERLAK